MDEIITAEEFTRLSNNFYQTKGIEVPYDRVVLDSQLCEYIGQHKEDRKQKFKVAFLCICLNSLYWPYAREMINGAKQFFLPGHQTDFFLWSDMPEGVNYGATVYPTEAVEWPMPTLMRYHLFLQQEEVLKDYDYIFYCDVDMKFVDIVGDEILGYGLTLAPHPGYFTRKELWPPYEPNPMSACHIKRPGKIVMMEGKPRFMPFYAAGGFQGGTAKAFIQAMKDTKELINADMNKNYIPIWNDETAWNKYIFDMLSPEELEKVMFLTPSYVYPDSLIKEYYEPKVWGCSYQPKLITITKKFATSAEGGEAVAKMIS